MNVDNDLDVGVSGAACWVSCLRDGDQIHETPKKSSHIVQDTGPRTRVPLWKLTAGWSKHNSILYCLVNAHSLKVAILLLSVDMHTSIHLLCL